MVVVSKSHTADDGPARRRLMAALAHIISRRRRVACWTATDRRLTRMTSDVTLWSAARTQESRQGVRPAGMTTDHPPGLRSVVKLTDRLRMTLIDLRGESWLLARAVLKFVINLHTG